MRLAVLDHPHPHQPLELLELLDDELDELHHPVPPQLDSRR